MDKPDECSRSRERDKGGAGTPSARGSSEHDVDPGCALRRLLRGISISRLPSEAVSGDHRKRWVGSSYPSDRIRHWPSIRRSESGSKNHAVRRPVRAACSMAEKSEIGNDRARTVRHFWRNNVPWNVDNSNLESATRLYNRTDVCAHRSPAWNRTTAPAIVLRDLDPVSSVRLSPPQGCVSLIGQIVGSAAVLCSRSNSDADCSCQAAVTKALNRETNRFRKLSHDFGFPTRNHDIRTVPNCHPDSAGRLLSSRRRKEAGNGFHPAASAQLLQPITWKR